MRIAFVGAVEFSRVCLEELLAQKADVAGVFTLPKEGEHYNTDYADLGPLCEEHEVPCHRVRKINDPEPMETLRALRPDIIFVFGWSQLIGKALLELPPMGCVGTHPALLPRNRGRHPLIWALVEGLERSGLTFFYLDEGADSGDILWQREFEITDQDDAQSLYGKIQNLARVGIREFLPQLESGQAPRIPQDEALATYWGKRTRKDGEIHWAESSRNIYNLIRALTRPYPGAHTFLNDREIKVWKAGMLDKPLTEAESSATPGTIIAREADGALDVRTGDGWLRVAAFEFADGTGGEIAPGMRLGGNE